MVLINGKIVSLQDMLEKYKELNKLISTQGLTSEEVIGLKNEQTLLEKYIVKEIIDPQVRCSDCKKIVSVENCTHTYICNSCNTYSSNKVQQDLNQKFLNQQHREIFCIYQKCMIHKIRAHWHINEHAICFDKEQYYEIMKNLNCSNMVL